MLRICRERGISIGHLAVCAIAVALVAVASMRQGKPYNYSHHLRDESQTESLDTPERKRKSHDDVRRNDHSTTKARSMMEWRLLQDSSLQTCLDNINAIASGGLLGMDEYLEFLALQSSGRIDVDSFSELPLELVALFYYVACSNQVCSQGTNSIDVDPAGDNSELLFDLCEVSQKSTNAASPDPSALRINRFNYIIAHDTGLTSEQILAGEDGNTIVADLMTATENVILKALNCTTTKSVNGGRKLAIQQTHPYPTGIDYSARLVELSQFSSLEKKPETPMTKMEQRHLQSGCGYEVSASVDDLQDTACTTPPPQGIACVLVTSSVEVVSAEPLSVEELSELRVLVVDALSTAIEDGTFVEALKKKKK